MELITPLWIVAAVSAAVSAALTPVLARWAERAGLMDVPGGRKAHPHPVPFGGGHAVALAFLASTGAAVAVAHWAPDWLPAGARVHAPGVVRTTPRYLAFVACACVMLFVGAWDDARPLGWKAKGGLSLVAGAAFALAVEPLELFLHGPEPWKIAIRVAATAVWVAGVSHLINWMDHHDGVAPAMVLVLSAALTVVAAQTGQWFMAGVSAALAGACAGFLPYNLPPAHVFWGDAGALFAGFVFGGATTLMTFYESGQPPYLWLVPLALISVPAWDAAFVVRRRAREGRPVTAPDRAHLAHRLVELGLSARSALAAIVGLTAISALAAVLLYFVETAGAMLVVLQLVLVLVVWRILEQGARK
jgi:UDP-GlcNAc:undecaprenyl-phosphate GlcNAc-1-phosphate transferase